MYVRAKKLIVITLAFLAIHASVLAAGSCSLRGTQDVAPEIQARYNELYQSNLSGARRLMDQSSDGVIKVGNLQFDSAEAYAQWASRQRAMRDLATERSSQLGDTIKDELMKKGHSATEAQRVVDQLNNHIERGHVVWDNGNFRFIDNDGNILGANLAPENIRDALESVRHGVANRAAELGDSGARVFRERVETADSLRESLRTQSSSGASPVQSQVQSYRTSSGQQVRNLESFDVTGTELSTRLRTRRQTRSFPANSRVKMVFNEDASEVTYFISDANGTVLQSDTLSAPELKDILENSYFDRVP